ncbi:Alpha/Beta hydrolase protein [Clohesyomyces aquaticus]|uniref:Carboxylic ester hydrolase n=1 Tax=Clohesyomyces aquaticus TaxID=1231657 RepID=A0A1Y1ZGV7_9PLEO|nr:Alpha/Beta hydrolase protein [Clohesyomyces aquaticus]
MASFIGLVAAAPFFHLAAPVKAVTPSPQSIGSDLTILTHNDLNGSLNSTLPAAIVLSTSQTLERAKKSCAALGETLWTPGNRTGETGFLTYLDHEKETEESSQYWISGGSECRTITTKGEVQAVPCGTHLPVLCSQSASVSSRTVADAARNGVLRFIPETDTGTDSRSAFWAFDIRRALRDSAIPIPECSEDCLFLKVWTPYLPRDRSASKKKAVMLWIHGGGFATGTGSDPTIDGGNLASRGDVVVVTINYRSATLGFLALSNTTIKGNYGLSDQIAALDWVRAQIADFGGDVDRIMVFGQSAGADCVRALLASPIARGKFSRAIMMSTPNGAGKALAAWRYMSIEESTQKTAALLDEVGCQWTNGTDRSIQLACLRAQDPMKLITSTYIARSVVADGTILTSNQLPLGSNSTPLDVSVMIGVMHDEGGATALLPQSLNTTQVLTDLGYSSSAILESNAFPMPTGNNATLDLFKLVACVATDAEFRCRGQSTAAAAAKNHIFPTVYSYEFDRSYQILEWSPNFPLCEAPKSAAKPHGDPTQEYFKCHSGDLYYAFGTLERQGRPLRDEDDIPFSQYIVDTWTSFARDGNLNPDLEFLVARGYTNTLAKIKRTGSWKPVQAGKQTLRILNTDVRDEGFRELEQCAALGYPLEYYYG